MSERRETKLRRGLTLRPDGHAVRSLRSKPRRERVISVEVLVEGATLNRHEPVTRESSGQDSLLKRARVSKKNSVWWTNQA